MKNIVLLLANLFLLEVVQAEDKATPIAITSPSMAGGLMQIIIALGLILLLIAALAWITKRVTPGGQAYKLPMSIVGALRIGTREKIMVLEIADQWIVVGVTANQITQLSSMPKQESATINSIPNESNPFKAWLNASLAKRSETKTTE